MTDTNRSRNFSQAKTLCLRKVALLSDIKEEATPLLCGPAVRQERKLRGQRRVEDLRKPALIYCISERHTRYVFTIKGCLVVSALPIIQCICAADATLQLASHTSLRPPSRVCSPTRFPASNKSQRSAILRDRIADRGTTGSISVVQGGCDPLWPIVRLPGNIYSLMRDVLPGPPLRQFVAEATSVPKN